ncbi:hypothetical protein P170DRAFT_504723 [Aspergillus steynii IBT 23096]|uniref:Xylanolytic transcriptional activator regulatory domain-containing protein n=1 Tax=Aspergillus steynii IBT 23096 TaxID=1392250 RepID=A0A2I2GLQ1_9EURO|nr:uncharacterized protein P170DRAFT_504723 [Aspergillus steynii IBT 23096]PLB53808.1 hypothetical protein P170DRAFT_504723 [Aspergillus steynii IBT 23096]
MTAEDVTQDLTTDYLSLSMVQSGDSPRVSTVTVSGAGSDDVALDHLVSRSLQPIHNDTAAENLSDSFGPAEITDGGGNPLEAIVTAPHLLPDNVNEAFQDSVNTQDLHASDIEIETGWASWLLCDDFNLDSINSSLLQATAGEASLDYHTDFTEQFNIQPLNMNSLPMKRKFQQDGDSIRRKWHTYCQPTPLGGMAPDPTPENGQIDEAYRQELAERLQPRVQTGILPSTTFIQLCLRAYFKHFQPIFPIVHEPSFRPCKSNSILLLSICSVGSLFLGSPRAMEHGISMFERLQKANVSSWETLISSSQDACIAALQAALIGQAFGFLVGRPKDLAGIDFFHGGINAWARKANVYRINESPCDPLSLRGDGWETAWKKWVATEEKKRIALGIAMQDAELMKLHLHEPILRHDCERLPITDSDRLFAAPNAIHWKRLMIANYGCTNRTQRPKDTPCHSETIRIPKGVSNFGQCALLDSIGVLAYESHQPTVFELNKAKRCQELLVEWYNSYQSTHASNVVWDSPLTILWHASFIMLYANLDLLERACGRDGCEADLDALGYARQWAKSDEAKRCLLHAAYIQNSFQSMPIGSLSPIHVPLCLYHCGMVWFCFGKFGGDSKFSKKKAEAQFKSPEFQLLRPSVSQSLNVVFGNLQQWDPTDQTFKFIELLQRVPHWKLPSNLAATLLALVEEDQNMF